MNWEHFEALSPDEAQSELDSFLTQESSAVVKLLDAAASAGINTTFSTTSARAILAWAVPFASSVPVSPSNDLPDWLRNAHEQHYGFSELDDASKILTFRCAYFLGQSFVTEFPILRWSTGDTETAIGNMPVVSGFLHDLELPPLLIVENLFSRIIDNPERIGDIDTSVDKWLESVPY